MSGNESRSRALREYVFLFCVLSCLTFENIFPSKFQNRNVTSATQFKRQAELSDNIPSMKRQKSHSVTTPQILSFKCRHCKDEFESSKGYLSHRTSIAAEGTPCSLEKNKSELVHTERHHNATGILQQFQVRSSKLGA